MIRPPISTLVYPPPEYAKIAVDAPDGVVIMTIVISDGVTVLRPNTDAEIQKEVNRNHPGMPWRRITDADIPADRTYRNAWKLSGNKIIHDMAKVIEIHKDKLRDERVPLLADLDAAYLQADEAGNKTLKAKIAARKKVLRDITTNPLVTSAASVDQIKTIAAAKILADFIAIQG